MLNGTALYIPTFVVVLGIVLNWVNTNSLRGEFNSLRSEFNSLRSEMSTFRNDMQSQMSTLRLDVMSELARVTESNHKDALEIMRQMTALHERVAVVEAKQA